MQIVRHHLTTRRRGDTFVEVCFALAIFSFIAVLAISSMNSNLATVQTTLESEVARSELDAQTEAIQYIHEAYVGDRNAVNQDNLAKAWQTITSKAISSSNATTMNNSWPPSNCDDYRSKYSSRLMAINTRALSENGSNIVISGNKISSAVVTPRLNYGDTSSLTTNASNTSLSGTEGVWFYAVKGDNSGTYYDVYVQSCWNTGNSITPHTIDTVIRLYNPDYMNNIEYKGTTVYEVHYNAKGGRFPNNSGEYVADWDGASNGFRPPTENIPTPINKPFTFLSWSGSQSSQTSPSFSRSNSCLNAEGKCVVTVYAWYGDGYAIHYNNGVDGNNVSGSVSGMPSPNPTDPVQASPTFKPFGDNGTVPTLASTNNYCYKFDGWSRTLGGQRDFDANNITLSTSDKGKVTELYAVWKKAPCGVYKVTLTWGAEPRDLDSHTFVTANGKTAETYYSHPSSDLSSDKNTVKVDLNYPPGDDTNGNGPEVTTITINNLSDFEVLFRVHRFSGSGSISSSGTKVVLERKDGDGNILSTYTYDCPSSGYTNDWDVFRIKNRNITKAY